MENVESNIEINSVIDLELEVSEDPMNSISELHAVALDKEVDPILAGTAEAMAVGPRTDADARQTAAPEVGHFAGGFEPRREATAVQRSVAIGAIACHDGEEQSAMYPIGYLYFGPQASASGAMFVDSSSEQGRELGTFEGPCSPHQHFEQALTSIWASTTPTTSAQTTTTTTLTSTVATCSAVGGPAYVPYGTNRCRTAGMLVHLQLNQHTCRTVAVCHSGD